MNFNCCNWLQRKTKIMAKLKIEVTADIDFCEVTVNGKYTRRWEGNSGHATATEKGNWFDLAKGELNRDLLELLEDDFSGFMALSSMGASELISN